MNYLTAHFALLVRGHLRGGQTVLVHGAAGGVGTACIQLAAALGARVIAVVSSAAKHEVALAAGAHDHASACDGFKDAVQRAHRRRGRRPRGRPGRRRPVHRLAAQPRPRGAAAVVGFTAGEIPTVKVNRLLLNNIDVVGVGWGAYALARPGYLAGQWAELEPAPALGRARPADQRDLLARAGRRRADR